MVELREYKQRRVGMNIEALVGLSKSTELDGEYVKGFVDRLIKREREFAERAKKQAITEKWLSRSYDI